MNNKPDITTGQYPHKKEITEHTVTALEQRALAQARKSTATPRPLEHPNSRPERLYTTSLVKTSSRESSKNSNSFFFLSPVQSRSRVLLALQYNWVNSGGCEINQTLPRKTGPPASCTPRGTSVF